MSELKGKLKNANEAGAAKKISEEDLDNVSGGYYETSGYASGYYIVCPNCGESRKNMINTWVESDVDELDGFQCINCGNIFGVNSSGKVWSEK